jgi:hypothetical protein
MKFEYEIKEEDKEKAEKIRQWQHGRWASMLDGFVKYLPMVFDGVLKVSYVTVDPKWKMVGGQPWAPIGSEQAVVELIFEYKDQTPSQLEDLKEAIEAAVLNPLFRNKTWASITIYDHENDRAIIRLNMGDALDSQLGVFSNEDHVNGLITILRLNLQYHLAGLKRLKNFTPHHPV